MDISTAASVISIVAIAVGALSIGISSIMNYYGVFSISKQKELLQQSFNNVVAQLSSDNKSAQLSAAVLLRRFFRVKLTYHFFINKKKHPDDDTFLKVETINVISSLLRTLPTGVYQKTLADGLASCDNLERADLQNTNLQNAYIGNDTHTISLAHVDLFMANLSKALIKNVNAQGAYMPDAILTDARIKNSDFSGADFRGADLTNCYFDKVHLLGADFTDAVNVPQEIASDLKNGKYTKEDVVSTNKAQREKVIFFSMSGSLTYDEAALIDTYKKFLRTLGYTPDDYKRDTYPKFGQLTSVKARIERCAGMIVFGSKQIFVKDGVFRPNLEDEDVWKNRWLSTAWNEIEVGMAIMRGIPILLVKSTELSTGIFDSCLNEVMVSTASGTTNATNLEEDDAIKAWLSNLRSI